MSKQKGLSILFAWRYRTKQGVWRGSGASAADDYAPAAARSDNPENYFIYLARNQKRFHSRYNFGYGILLYIRKMPRFCPETAHLGGFEGVFSCKTDKSAIACLTKTEVADFVSFKGSIVQVLNYCIDCNM